MQKAPPTVSSDRSAPPNGNSQHSSRPTSDATGASDFLEAEQDVRAKLGDLDLDFDANMAISNIYRAASAVRARAEREVLAEHGLSWGGLTILWVLWVWGDMPTSRLADECGLAKGTLTGMLTTLEKRDLVARHRVAEDKRKMMVRLTRHGDATISELFPNFNTFEVDMVSGLDRDDQLELARLLRIVITNAGQD